MKNVINRALALSLPLGLAAFAAEELYRYVFARGGSPLLARLLDKKGHADDYYLHRDSAAEALRSAPQERFALRSKRGETLHGYYLPCGGSGGKRIAFLVHGYRSEHAETAGMYKDYYASRGFDLFCCDNTAHGTSEGRLIGFGAFEAEDCLDWLEFLRERFGGGVQVILHGFSMGAATVLGMSDRIGENVRFIVEDSGYADARAQLRGQLGPAFRPMAALHRLIARCDLADTDVRPHLARAAVPILFVHGEDDRTVPFFNGPMLYKAYRGEKDCLFVPGAKHVESMHAAPDAYQAKLDQLIDKYIRQEQTI